MYICLAQMHTRLANEWSIAVRLSNVKSATLVPRILLFLKWSKICIISVADGAMGDDKTNRKHWPKCALCPPNSRACGISQFLLFYDGNFVICGVDMDGNNNDYYYYRWARVKSRRFIEIFTSTMYECIHRTTKHIHIIKASFGRQCVVAPRAQYFSQVHDSKTHSAFLRLARNSIAARCVCQMRSRKLWVKCHGCCGYCYCLTITTKTKIKKCSNQETKRRQQQKKKKPLHRSSWGW